MTSWVRGRRVWIAAVAALLVALALGSAGPAQAEGEEDTGGFGAFRLKGTNGYTVLALAFSKPGFKHGHVLLFVVGRKADALYVAPAKVTATSIDADLGAVGQISVDFEPRGDRETVESRCGDEGKTSFQPGNWVGTIEFRGEEGFTAAEANSTPSLITPFLDLVCGVAVGGEAIGPGLPGARLVARSANKRQVVSLQANQNRPGSRLKLGASIEERSGKLTVTRGVEGFYPSRGFDFDPQLRFARLRPSGPYAGVGVFRRDAKPANRWTGSLSVDFPGRSNVHLTGSRFRASLAHARFTREHHSADASVRPNLLAWPSTKPSPTAFARSSLLAPR
jgi:hypothetical protein